MLPLDNVVCDKVGKKSILRMFVCSLPSQEVYLKACGVLQCFLCHGSSSPPLDWQGGSDAPAVVKL